MNVRNRVDDAQPLDDRRLIEMGHLVLQSLAAEARAARAESHQAELEVAISEATRGSPDLLRTWLANYQSGTTHLNPVQLMPTHSAEQVAEQVAERVAERVQGRLTDRVQERVARRVQEQVVESVAERDIGAGETEPNTQTLEKLLRTEQAVSDPAAEPARVIRSWDQLLPHARARLAAIAKSPDPATTSTPAALTKVDTAVPQSASVVLPAQCASESDSEEASVYTSSDSKLVIENPHQDPTNATTIPGPVKEPVKDEEFDAIANSQSELLDFEPAASGSKELAAELEKEPKKELEYEDLAELQGLEAVQCEDGNRFFRSDKRGLLVSVVVHSALICSLMAITMRIPTEVASLGFESQSVDGDFESIEIAQPVEIAAPEVAAEAPSDPTSDPTMSTPSSLPSTSSVLSSSSSVSQAAASSSMASSLAESAGKAVTGGGKPSLSKVNASFFGAAAGGNSFCYVIDGSESMRGGPWEAAKRELLRSLSTLKENQRFYIIFFNQELNSITQPGEREPSTAALYATPENVKHAQNWVESLRIARGAPPGDALERAIELELDAIYFLADGATKVDVPSFLRTKNRTNDFISGEQIRVPIHAIAFYSPEIGQRLMQKIASENKGQFIYVPDPRKK